MPDTSVLLRPDPNIRCPSRSGYTRLLCGPWSCAWRGSHQQVRALGVTPSPSRLPQGGETEGAGSGDDSFRIRARILESGPAGGQN